MKAEASSMINKELRLTAQIGSDGRLYINNQPALDVFTRKHKEHRAIIEVKVIGKDASEAMKKYYRAFIIPEFRKAFMENGEYLTLKETEERTELTPMLWDEHWSEKAQDWIKEPVNFEELDNYTAVHCITHLKQLAALDFGFDIEDESFINT